MGTKLFCLLPFKSMTSCNGKSVKMSFIDEKGVVLWEYIYIARWEAWVIMLTLRLMKSCIQISLINHHNNLIFIYI